MPRTIPDDVAEGIVPLMRTLLAMMKSARREHRKNPSPTGLYPVTLVMDGEGNIVGDGQGAPLVVVPPISVAGLDAASKTILFFHTEQHVSPKNVAALADVHVATVNRAVKSGELPKPVQISSRRVGHLLIDVHRWLASKKAS